MAGEMPDSTDLKERIEHNDTSWESARTVIVAGTDDDMAASWYLTESRIWPFLTNRAYGPLVLGCVLFLIIVATVIFSPSTESHFIYTDF